MNPGLLIGFGAGAVIALIVALYRWWCARRNRKCEERWRRQAARDRDLLQAQRKLRSAQEGLRAYPDYTPACRVCGQLDLKPQYVKARAPNWFFHMGWYLDPGDIEHLRWVCPAGCPPLKTKTLKEKA